MRDYLRKQNREAVTGVAEVVASVNPKEPARYKGRFKLNTWSHKTRTKALNVRRERGIAIEPAPKRFNKQASTPEDADADLELMHPKQHRTPNPVFFLDGRQLDPFDSLSVELGSRSEKLLLHCKLLLVCSHTSHK